MRGGGEVMESVVVGCVREGGMYMGSGDVWVDG